MPTIRMLRTFWLVAQTGSFAAAAEKAALTQAAVSLQMKGLEEELKRRLFDRSGRQIRLTRQGREIMPKIEQMLALMTELEAKPARAMQGGVTIGAVVSVIDALAMAVARLKAAHPLLDVRLTTARSDELTAMVEAGEVDIAAVVAREDNALPERLARVPLYSEPMMLVVNRDIADTEPHRILRMHGFLRYDRLVRTGHLVQKALTTLNLEVNEYLELSSIETIVALVRRNLGVSVLPRLHRGGWEDDQLLRLIPIASPPITRSIGIIWRADAVGLAKIAEAIADVLHSP